MDPPVPRPHVPWNEKMALYSGIFLYVPPMYPYTIDWGLISHVPKVMLMYPSLKLGIGPSCTQSIPHVPTFIETGFWSLLYPSCTPVYFPCILHWDWGLISPVPLMYPLLFFLYPSLRLGFGPPVPLMYPPFFFCTPHIPLYISHVSFIETGVRSLLYPPCTPFYSSWTNGNSMLHDMTCYLGNRLS